MPGLWQSEAKQAHTPTAHRATHVAFNKTMNGVHPANRRCVCVTLMN